MCKPLKWLEDTHLTELRLLTAMLVQSHAKRILDHSVLDAQR